MSSAAATSTVLTTRPSGPVCLVTSVLPSIAWACAVASVADLASLTPPLKPSRKTPLPRPPAWICDFTTASLCPALKILSAAALASSMVLHGSPAGTVTPYCLSNCLAWYSWMFIPGKSPLVKRHHLQPHWSSVNRLWADEPVVGELLEHVRRPAARARDGKNGCKQIRRDAKRVIHRGRVKIDIGGKGFLLEHQFGNAFRHLDPLGLADLGAEDLSHPFEVWRAWIEHLVNAVTYAHDLALVGQGVLDVLVHFFE